MRKYFVVLFVILLVILNVHQAVASGVGFAQVTLWDDDSIEVSWYHAPMDESYSCVLDVRTFPDKVISNWHRDNDNNKVIISGDYDNYETPAYIINGGKCTSSSGLYVKVMPVNRLAKFSGVPWIYVPLVSK